MRAFFFLVIFATGLAPSPAQDGAPAETRRLVISAPGPEHPAYREQAAVLLPAWRGLLERDFVIETRFGPAAFSVVLIGKDGGEKLRQTTPLAPADLFALVDAMPMRQAEIRERQPARK
ncbi:MAG: DUF4174 domain-containing protein [Lacunisphaera sp.]|nr:DUF4174 domain-containing protein [Lacunisphaera sp.]